MARFYGNLTGSRGYSAPSSTATRTGCGFVRASVRSRHGSVTVALSGDGAGTLLELLVPDGSATGGRTLLRVPLSQLLGAERLDIVSR